MTKTIRLTMAQALTRFLTSQMTVIDGRKVPVFAGVWAIFGHGNVAGLGEALYQVRDELPIVMTSSFLPVAALPMTILPIC